MAYASLQSPWWHSLNLTNNSGSNGFSSFLPKPTFTNFIFFNTLRATSSSSSSSPNSKGMKPDPVKTAFEKAKAYRKAVQLDSKPVQMNDPGVVPTVAKQSEQSSGAKKEPPVLEARNDGNQEVPMSTKFAMEKAKDYEKNNGVMGNDKGVKKSHTISGLEDQNQKTLQNSLSQNNTKKEENLSVSGFDFVGLGFADKKISRGLPPGLQPFSEQYPGSDLPDVEILVGYNSRFEKDTATKLKMIEKDVSEIYKPKVSTWGVFPRPSNISKTFGGGRIIRPGEQLETVEDKASKHKRTRELLSAYRKRTGINIDLNLKLKCEKIIEDGDSLMDLGKLEEAIPFYQEVMDKLPFQSELHGLAALQWSICQDSLSRSNEARIMYEKLQSHTNYKVSKRAKQFMFGFQAMEMMKVKSTCVSAANTGYQKNFEAFIERTVDYSRKDFQVEEQDEGAFGQAIPYVVFFFPFFLVLLFAVQHGM